MPSVHSKNLEVYNAKQFKASVTGTTGANLYLTFGKTVPWAAETQPPVPSTSVYDYASIWKNMIGGKKITGNDVCLAVPRHNWTSGTVYAQYSDIVDSKDLKNPNTPFYVVTDEFNVYKCLSNANGSRSIVKPTSTTTTSHFQTADKYIWKYMFTISSEDQLRFMTPQFIPVRTLTIPDGSTQWIVQNTAISGAVHTVDILARGTGYTLPNVWAQVVGDGRGANAFAVLDGNGGIAEVIIDDEGRGYSRAEVYIWGGGGRGARARASIATPNGHGSDPEIELGASYLVISVQMKGTENGKMTVANDFRQVAIIENPTIRGSVKKFSNATFSQTTTVALTGTSLNYVKDEYVFQGNSFRYSTFRGVVTDWNPGTNQLQLVGIEGSPINDQLIGYTSSAIKQLLAITIQPELQDGSGKLLYVDNIPPVQRDSEQTEDFKIVLSF